MGGLDSEVDPKGENFSVGEKQLFSFARALIGVQKMQQLLQEPRQSNNRSQIYPPYPLLLLDEATANVDFFLDELLHNVILGQNEIDAFNRNDVVDSSSQKTGDTGSKSEQTESKFCSTSSTQKANIFKDTTVVWIMHRLHFVNRFDKVLVFDDGHLVEQGAPKELLKQKNGMLQKLVKRSRQH